MIQECIKASADGRPYSQALRIGDFIFVSGQVPEHAEGYGVYDQTMQCFEKISSILSSCGISLSYILKTTAYITDMKDIPELDRAYAAHFSEPYPVTTTVSVKELPNDSKVAIEVFAMDTRALEVMCAGETGMECGETGCFPD